jgi:hypothetical protein
VNLFVFAADYGWNAAVPSVSEWLASITIPQRLLLLSALAYGGVFAAVLAYGRPGLGIGQGFYVAIILAAAATSAPLGALAGAGALFLYELGIHNRAGLSLSDFGQASTMTRLATYVAAGVLTGFLARRGRLMLAQSLFVLEDLVELAHGRIEEISSDAGPGRNAPPE